MPGSCEILEFYVDGCHHCRMIGSADELMGKLVLIPTFQRPIQDFPTMVSGFSIVAMKGIKRKSMEKPESSKEKNAKGM